MRCHQVVKAAEVGHSEEAFLEGLTLPSVITSLELQKSVCG